MNSIQFTISETLRVYVLCPGDGSHSRVTLSFQWIRQSDCASALCYWL